MLRAAYRYCLAYYLLLTACWVLLRTGTALLTMIEIQRTAGRGEGGGLRRTKRGAAGWNREGHGVAGGRVGGSCLDVVGVVVAVVVLALVVAADFGKHNHAL